MVNSELVSLSALLNVCVTPKSMLVEFLPSFMDTQGVTKSIVTKSIGSWSRSNTATLCCLPSPLSTRVLFTVYVEPHFPHFYAFSWWFHCWRWPVGTALRCYSLQQGCGVPRGEKSCVRSALFRVAHRALGRELSGNGSVRPPCRKKKGQLASLRLLRQGLE